MTKKKNSEVVVKEETAVATLPDNFVDAADEVSTSDIKMARIKVMASNAELVKTDVARAGAIIDLEAHEELGYKETNPMEFVILRQYKYWYQTINGDFSERAPALGRKDREWNYTDEQGNKVSNDYYHEFVVLLVDQINKGIELPYTLRFRRSELKQLDKVTKRLVRLKRANQRSWAQTFKLTAPLIPGNNNESWFGPAIAIGEESSQKIQDVSLEWAMRSLSVDLNPTTKALPKENAQLEKRF